MQELEKILEEIEAEHPYKVPGNYDSYSQYNEAWQDAIDRVRARLEEFFKEKDNDGWIPVEREQPEEDGFYIATMDGKIVGQEEPFVGLAEFENGKWIDDEEDYKCVIAWRPMPEVYRTERSRENEK